MNSESFRGQPLLFHAPPPAPAFTFIYCAVNVNAPADRFQFHEDSSELADVLFRLLHQFIIVCVGVRLPFADGRPAGGRRVCVRVVVVINFLLFCPTFSAVLSIRSYHSI